jgi:hypothetical protein
MASFSPLTALGGGALIGLAAVLFALFNGRVAGVSGIAGGILGGVGRDFGWRIAFIVGLVLGAVLLRLITGEALVVEMQTTLPWLIAGGVLVGFGTALGSGCTSGHGVCGMSRGQPRSIVATLVFLGTAVVTVYLVRHVLAGGAS